MKKTTCSSGFTLVELMMALLIGGIVMGAVFTSFNSQHRTYLAQDQAVQMQQSARAAMDFMGREIRMAGFDPLESAGATITAATAGSLSFSMDENRDGDSSDTNESVTYQLYTNADGILSLGRRNINVGAGINQGVANFIDNLEFFYTLADGTRTLTPDAIEFNDIRAVQVTILARAAVIDPSYRADVTYTTPGGQDWVYNNTNLRRRLVTRLIQCRNMGM